MAQKKRQPARRKSSSRKTTRSGSAARKKRSSSDKRRRNATRRWLGRAGLLLVVSAAAIVVWLDYRIVSAFEGRRWDLPARVYARPLELAAGETVVLGLPDLGADETMQLRLTPPTEGLTLVCLSADAEPA